MSGPRIVDDRDISVVYSVDQWAQAGIQPEYASTSTITNSRGAVAKVTFSGTQINVYGTIAELGSSAAPSSSYSIDGGKERKFVPSQGTKALYQQLFFQSRILPSGPHTLIITNKVDNDMFSLDYFVIDQFTAPSNTSSTIPLPSAATASTFAGRIPSTVDPTQSQPTPSLVPVTDPSSPDSSTTSTATAAGTKNSNHRSQTGKIVGGLFGGLILLALVAAAIFMLVKRRRGPKIAPSAMFMEEVRRNRPMSLDR